MEQETNVRTMGTLKEKGVKLLEAAMEYWEEYRKVSGPGAVVWLRDEDGRLVLLTRGEYTSTLMQNIERMPWSDEKFFDE